MSFGKKIRRKLFYLIVKTPVMPIIISILVFSLIFIISNVVTVDSYLNVNADVKDVLYNDSMITIGVNDGWEYIDEGLNIKCYFSDEQHRYEGEVVDISEDKKTLKIYITMDEDDFSTKFVKDKKDSMILEISKEKISLFDKMFNSEGDI